jgi:MoaA/NifB/PqqE/SkfB family radical SAM enzyme
MAPIPLSAPARKARVVRGFLRGDPVHCTWQLTPRCESFCHLCDHRAESAGDEIDADGCRRVAEELARRSSLLVSFTGSEPFLRSDLPEVVGSAAHWHLPLLVTNGWLVTRQRARAVWEAGLEVATVAIDHADPARQDASSGLPGSHARAVAALRILGETRTRISQRINVRTRVHDAGLSGLDTLLTLAAGSDATVSVEVAFPLPSLDGEAALLVDRLREHRRRHPNLRTGGWALEGIRKAVGGGVPGCLAGRAFFNVDHRGRVSKCVEFRREDDRVGTLPGDATSTLLPRLREVHARNDCRQCWYASRAEVESLYTVRGFLGGLSALVRA